eukprot:CAMPEP_0197736278 /NCGR_PEP_ID=MMETSP1435-20131217/1570_1 /TAXON_ID=426625 /ORGANISM="Chaetoceros brevis, Strain CCMP164" /LENGTH=81 /DNA_ID=CAMNT_0043324365 /DNA_START=24 /DNA_END=269 /DNA_ORIENTATION=+
MSNQFIYTIDPHDEEEGVGIQEMKIPKLGKDMLPMRVTIGVDENQGTVQSMKTWISSCSRSQQVAMGIFGMGLVGLIADAI